MANDLSFEKLHNNRKLFLKQNDNVGHKVIEGSNILLSAPHAVSQVRLGKNKVAEIGSHAELVQSGGLYSKIYHLQTQGMVELVQSPATKTEGGAE